MKDILFKIIDKFTEGVDTYHNHGSMWLIFTDEKKWVIELTKEGTLWYNFYFFQDCFKYVSLDVVENQHYITEWVESIIQNGVRSTNDGYDLFHPSVESIIQNGVKHTDGCQIGTSNFIEDAIQNGVKSTNKCFMSPWVVEDTIKNAVKSTEDSIKERTFFVEDTIQNGVKSTIAQVIWLPECVESAIQNGVKETKHDLWDGGLAMEDAIQNGVKRTELGGKDRKIDEIKDIVENGIKETHEDVYHHNGRVEGVIKNGIKETNPHLLEIYNPMNFEPEIKEMKRMNEVNIVLEKGIKEVKELPDQSGEFIGYGDYYYRQEDRTKPHTQYVDDVVRDGIKETKYCELHSLMRADHIIRDGDKIDV